MEHIDYNSVADIYDLYAAATYDFEFFSSLVNPGMQVLELTSGTGRLSIPLIEAGATLTCVDISQAMLDVLSGKLRDKKLKATLVCADILSLDYSKSFELAILPFQSFMELVGETKQRNALSSIYKALLPGARFFCTMHNPAIRRKTVDGVLRGVGTFSTQGGETLVVSGFETGGNPVVHRSQFFEHYDKSSNQTRKLLQVMEFELIEEGSFRQIAIDAGFSVVNLYGDYEGNVFNPDSSPFMIWELGKQ